MVYIDTDGLRQLATSMDPIRDELIPLDSLHEQASRDSFGSDRLAAALESLRHTLMEVRIVQAREVDFLISAGLAAANTWEQAESTLSAGHGPH